MSAREQTGQPEPQLTALGRAVRAQRLERGLSIEALAHEAGMSAGHLGTIERGHGNPTLATLYDLAEALDMPLSVLLSEAKARDEPIATT